MRKNAMLFATLGFLLAGCAPSPFSAINEKLDALKGKPIKSVTDALGDPDQISEAGNEKSYQWNLTSNLGAAYNVIAFRCTIIVFADKDDKITRYSYDGNNGGCSRYATKLDSGYHFVQGILD